MLIGEYQHFLEEKGRLAIPAKLRKINGADISVYVVTKGLEHCLFMYPLSEWEERIVKRMDGLALGNKSAREFKRFILGSAAEVLPDGQGRVNIPQNLREYAGIDKEVTISAVGDRIELWDTQTWRDHIKRIEAGAEQYAGDMEAFGI
jgi:MraZ protein